MRDHWGSKITFVMAATGSAIGLGNVWKFPYMAGLNGGGAFVLVYLATIAVVGLPILVAEVLLGRTAQEGPVGAFNVLLGRRTPWRFVGWIGALASFGILSFYTVVTGWTLHYCLLSLRGKLLYGGPEAIGSHFDELFVASGTNLIWHALVSALLLWVAVRGVRRGIETLTKFLMPTLGGMLVVLLIYALRTPGAMEGITFLFKPDFSKLNGVSVLEAVGHGFFTLSLGMATMITYGSYLSRKSEIARVSVAIVFFDTLIALVAGMVIFPIVFSFGLEAAGGPGLVFKTLPIAFSQLPGGKFFCFLFFLLLFFAALTSAVSLFEGPVAVFVDEMRMSRKKASAFVGGIIFLLGIPAALSGGALSGFKVPGFDKTFFDTMDYLTTNWLLPLGGLFVAIFVGWIVAEPTRKDAFELNAPKWWLYAPWKFFLRFVAPLGVIIVFLYKLGILSLPS